MQCALIFSRWWRYWMFGSVCCRDSSRFCLEQFPTCNFYQVFYPLSCFRPSQQTEFYSKKEKASLAVLLPYLAQEQSVGVVVPTTSALRCWTCKPNSSLRTSHTATRRRLHRLAGHGTATRRSRREWCSHGDQGGRLRESGQTAIWHQAARELGHAEWLVAGTKEVPPGQAGRRDVLRSFTEVPRSCKTHRREWTHVGSNGRKY